MRIWIDQSKCQNSGLCEEEAPQLFAIGEDFYAYVREDGKALEGGEAGRALVPEHLEELAEACAAACPAQCIHLDA